MLGKGIYFSYCLISVRLIELGLLWAEIARRIGTSPYTLWRWIEAGVRPHWRH